MARRGRPPLGQHFLRSDAVLDAILTAADVRPGERVLEVGPGEGILTRPLLDAVGPDGEVVAVEYDAALAKRLRVEAPRHLRVVHGDAVQVDLEMHGPYDRIVSNLPYQISGPITARFLALMAPMPWGRAVLLVQREFGQRLLAEHGSAAYGRLSVQRARWCTALKVRDVPPGCFDPPPEVDSLVLRLDPHASAPFAVADDALWDACIDGAFQQRRKKLRNTLPQHVQRTQGVPAPQVLAALEQQNVDDRPLAEVRPQDVPPEAFAELVARLAHERAQDAGVRS